MIKTSTKIVEEMDQEFNFGNLDIGNELDSDELDVITPVEDSEENPDEEESDDKPEEDKSEDDKPEDDKEESTDESTEDEVEEADEEGEEKEESEETEEESEELTTEEVIGDPLKDAKEDDDEPKGRTYEGFDDEDKQYAKQMSNKAYDHFSKKLQALKVGKSSAEETQDLLSHPEAYSLNPEYQQLVTDYDKASQEQAHWKKQLVAIRNGENWRSVEGYDKSGRLVMARDDFQPTAEAEIDVQGALTEAQSMSKSFSHRAGAIQRNHSNDYKNSVQMLDEEQRKQFKWLEDKDMAKQQQELTEKVKKQSRNKKDMLRSEPSSKSTKSTDDDDMFTIGDMMNQYIS